MGRLLKNGTVVRYGVLALFGVLIWCTLWFLREYLNILYFDTSGHASSAYFFGTYGFHAYVPDQFGWYVQNLLYPPLQDVLVHVLKRVSWLSYLQAIHRYMMVLLLLYVYVRYKGTEHFSSFRIKALRLLFAIVFLRTDRQYIIMGGSMDDMIRIGLLPQILGCVFFLLLLYELIGKRRFWTITLRLILAILSHLVMGMLSLGLVVTIRLVETIVHVLHKEHSLVSESGRTTSKLLGSIVVALCCTAFFRFPFGVSVWSSTVGMIVQPIPYALFGVLLLPLVLRITTTMIRWLRVCAAGLTLIARLAISRPSALPVFQYARLLSPALLIGVFALLLHLDELCKTEQRKYAGVWGSVTVALFRLVTVQFPLSFPWQRLKNPDFVNIDTTYASNEALPWEQRDEQPSVPLHPVAWQPRTQAWASRILFANTKISPLLSASQALGSRLHSVNGLYRESHYSNVQFVSFYATLFGNVGFILPQYQAFWFSCDEYQRLRDSFVHVYAISTLILPKHPIVDVGPPEMQECLRTFVMQWGIEALGFMATSSISIAGKDYTVYVHSWIQLGEVLSSRVHLLGVPDLRDAHREIMQAYYSQMKSEEWQPLVIVHEDSVPRLSEELASQWDEVNDISVTRTETGEGVVMLPEGRDLRFRIQAHRFPGMTLIDADGAIQPLYAEAFWMVGKGSGSMKLVYKIPVVFRIGYSISILSGVVLCIRLLFRRNRA